MKRPDFSAASAALVVLLHLGGSGCACRPCGCTSVPVEATTPLLHAPHVSRVERRIIVRSTPILSERANGGDVPWKEIHSALSDAGILYGNSISTMTNTLTVSEADVPRALEVLLSRPAIALKLRLTPGGRSLELRDSPPPPEPLPDRSDVVRDSSAPGGQAPPVLPPEPPDPPQPTGDPRTRDE